MSMSFGVAIAGLATAVFLPASATSNPAVFIRGIHRAFVATGTSTALSALIFKRLKGSDGERVSHHSLHTRDFQIGSFV
jgi:hypothetical protein